MNQTDSPQPTRRLVTSQGTAPGLPGAQTAAGNQTSGTSTTSTTAIQAVSAPPSKPTGWIVSAIILSLGLLGAATFGYMEWNNGNELTAEVAGLNEKVNGLQSDLAALKVENAKNLANYEETKSKLELAENRGLELQKELEEKQKTLTETIADRDQMRTTVAKKDEELESKDRESTKLRDENQQLDQNLASLKVAGTEMEQELTQLRKENENLKKKTVKTSFELVSAMPDPKPSTEGNASQATVTKARPRGIAWTRLGEYKTGENKGKWYYVSPDGYISKLYTTRKEATDAAENRSGYTQTNYR